MVLTAYGALSPATNSSCHRRRRISGLARPGWARNTSADLTPATGARTTRFCRPRPPSPRGLAGQCTPAKTFSKAGSAPFVLRVLTKNPPCHHLAPNAAASTASRPNVRDDGQRPSSRAGMAEFVVLIWGRREAVYFCARDWTGSIRLIGFKKFARFDAGLIRRFHRGDPTYGTL